MLRCLFFYLSSFFIYTYAQQIPQNITREKTPQSVTIYNHNEAGKDDEIIKLIIGFTDQPAVKLSKSLRKTVNKNARSAQFSDDLTKISQKFSDNLKKNTTHNISINKEFYKLFSGVQVDVPRKFIPYISGLNYVKKIYVDNNISANLDVSVPLIKADQIWSTLNNRGKGIKISIIDTGIDYLHEALGGGFGPGFKVTGGYDFVNRDSDPMDDHGHGTHVAGITAANSSSLSGVAPEASLIACKVFDSQGHGYFSTVIEAIEYSIDPNNDGDYSDAADVINLSLGGPGTPDDPTCQAVNNASDIGTVVCISAGNDGNNGFYTINSPGCAENAITAGNATKLKEFNGSSSKGPNTGNFNIKPDLLAPGTDIKSCKLSGGVTYLSGTSMASPHIAGICALIKKQHPEWTSNEIKSALKTTAERLNYEPMQQGSGLVDALKAINVKTFVIPSDLSFGICDTTNTTWSTTKILKIKNIYLDEQHYNISVSSNNPGINFTITNTGFRLSPGDSLDVEIKMEVNNNIVEYRNSGSYSYSGYFQISGTHDTLTLPWAFIKRQMIELRFEKPNADFILSSNANNFYPSNATWADLYTARLTVPNDSYDFISTMISNDTLFTCIKKDMNLNGTNVIVISTKESKNEIHLDAKDEYGRKIINLRNQHFGLQLYNKQKFNYTVFFSNGRNYSCFISDVPDNYLLSGYQYCMDKDTIRAISHEPVSSQVSDIFFTNDPKELGKQKIKFIYNKNVIKPGLLISTFMIYHNERGATIYLGDALDAGITNNNWEGYIVRNERISANPSYNFYIEARNSDPASAYWAYSFVTAPTYAKNKQFFMSQNNEITPDLFIENNPHNPVVIGGDLLFATAEYSVSYYYFTQHNLFLGQMMDNRDVGGINYFYKSYNSANEITDSGKTSGYELFSTLWNNSYLKTEYYTTDHSRFTNKSMAMLTSVIRNHWDDLIPPVLTSLQVRNSQGKPRDVFAKDEPFQIRFSLKDPNLNEDSIKIEIKDYYSNVWKSCPFQKIDEHELIGKLFSASPDSIQLRDINLLSMRLSYQDKNGNAGIWLLDPAILIGEPVTPVELSSFSAVQKGKNIVLNWSSATETNNHRFEIERKLITGLNEKEWVKIGSVNGTGNSSTPTNYSYSDNISNNSTGKIKYRLKQIDLDGTFNYSNEAVVEFSLPANFALFQNYPNPFNPSTTINYILPEPGKVALKIYNLLGEVITQLEDDYKTEGNYSVEFNAGSIASGTYFYELKLNNFVTRKKMMIIK